MARKTLSVLGRLLVMSSPEIWEWCVDQYEYSCCGREPYTLWLVRWDTDSTVAEASSLEAAVRLSLRHAAAAILAQAGRATQAGRQQIEPGAPPRLKP